MDTDGRGGRPQRPDRPALWSPVSHHALDLLMCCNYHWHRLRGPLPLPTPCSLSSLFPSLEHMLRTREVHLEDHPLHAEPNCDRRLLRLEGRFGSIDCLVAATFSVHRTRGVCHHCRGQGAPRTWGGSGHRRMPPLQLLGGEPHRKTGQVPSSQDTRARDIPKTCQKPFSEAISQLE